MRMAFGLTKGCFLPHLLAQPCWRCEGFPNDILVMMYPPCQQDPRDAYDAVRKLDGHKGWLAPSTSCRLMIAFACLTGRSRCRRCSSQAEWQQGLGAPTTAGLSVLL